MFLRLARTARLGCTHNHILCNKLQLLHYAVQVAAPIHYQWTGRPYPAVAIVCADANATTEFC